MKKIALILAAVWCFAAVAFGAPDPYLQGLNLGVKVKADVAEHLMHKVLCEGGYELVDCSVGSNGLDGLYVAKNAEGTVTDVIVAECKTDSARLARLDNGQGPYQLSREYNLRQIDKKLDQLRLIKNPGRDVDESIRVLEQTRKYVERDVNVRNRLFKMDHITSGGKTAIRLQSYLPSFVKGDGAIPELKEASKPIILEMQGSRADSRFHAKLIEEYYNSFKKIIIAKAKHGSYGIKEELSEEVAEQITRNLREAYESGRITSKRDLIDFISEEVRYRHLSEAERAELTRTSTLKSIRSTIKAGLPKKLLSGIAKSRVTKAAKSAAKIVGKSKIYKSASKTIPIVLDVAFWVYEIYDTTERYYKGEITTEEAVKEDLGATVEAVGAVAGFKVAADATSEALKNRNSQSPYDSLVILGAGVCGAVAGGWAAKKISDAAYDVMVGEPVETCLKDAKESNPTAMYFAGRFYDEPRYVNRDYITSLHWFKLSESAGFEKSKVRLANCYLVGKGTKPNYRKAYLKYSEAFEQGDLQATIPLARMSIKGLGCAENTRKAIDVLKQAADKNYQPAKDFAESWFAKEFALTEEYDDVEDPTCFRKVGEFFEAGLVVEMSQERAEELFSLAAAEGDELAAAYLQGSEVIAGDEADDSALDEIFEANKLLKGADDKTYIAGLRELAEVGHYRAQLEYAPYDETDAGKWWQMNAERNNLYATKQLIAWLKKEDRSDKEICKWVEKGADLGDMECLNELWWRKIKGSAAPADVIAAELAKLRRNSADAMYDKLLQDDVVMSSNFVASVQHCFASMDKKALRKNSFYFCPKFDPDKQRKARQKMRIRDEDLSTIAAQYDSTALGGGSEGFVLAESGIYFSNGTTLYCKWEDVDRFEVWDSGKIHLVGRCVNTADNSPYKGGYIEYKDKTALLVQSGALVDVLNFIALKQKGRFAVYENSFQEVKTAAESGDAQAQLRLGLKYYQGDGVVANVVTAEHWIRKSADQGCALAENWMGRLYEFQHGCGQDYKEAFSWYMKAAEKGVVNAGYNVGRMYLYGKGVDCNYAKAMEYLLDAASKGSAEANKLLGQLYKDGLCVDEDQQKSDEYFRKAAEASVGTGLTDNDGDMSSTFADDGKN